ncbi:MAG: bifunctional pyr operon transcriptional regulator/uracil phosphoribosyltransferase [bacterium TMED217]|nr:MAG: bifunctional pyr operon transcriptional regulator/uracil phosphoribosyltransferase [bacterium TMED217]|tara:strand:+ start:21238 stop:21780 length:543 start_codon:yes stop_codon:yes gene_type:complete
MKKNVQILSSKDIEKKLIRISHEIVENHNDIDNIVMLGIHNRGVPIAQRINEIILKITNIDIPLGSLDITFHRDDFRDRLLMPEIRETKISFSLDDKVVVLVDDVLYSGRTIRAALDEINSFGRPSLVRLAVLIDRGHRELPIRADFIGKNIPTNSGEHVDVRLRESDNEEGVFLVKNVD